MSKYYLKLITDAEDKYGDIFPIKNNGFNHTSFTQEGVKLFFWFNTVDRSTHVMSCEIKNK